MLTLVRNEPDYLKSFYLWLRQYLFWYTEEEEAAMKTPLLNGERTNYWQMIQPIQTDGGGLDDVTANRIRYELTSLEENTESGRQDYAHYTLTYYK